MGWQDDLAHLLGETVGQVPKAMEYSGKHFFDAPTPSSPWQEALNALTDAKNPLRGIAQAAVPAYDVHNYTDPLQKPWDVLKPFQQTMSIPQHLLQSGLGLADLPLAYLQANVPLPGSDPESGRKAIEAFQQGGGQGVWDYVVSQQPWFIQAVMTLGTDPLNYIPLGVAARTATKLAGAAGMAEKAIAATPVIDRADQMKIAAKAITDALTPEETQSAIDALGAIRKQNLADPVAKLGFGLGSIDPLNVATPTATNPLTRLAAGAGYRTLSGLQGLYDLPGALVADPLRTGAGRLANALHTPGDAADLTVVNPKLLDLSKEAKVGIWREKYYGLLQGWDKSVQRLGQEPGMAPYVDRLRQGLPLIQDPFGRLVTPEDVNPTLQREFAQPSITNPDRPLGDVLKEHLRGAQADFQRVRDAFLPTMEGQKPAWNQGTPWSERINIATRYDHANPPGVDVNGDKLKSMKQILEEWQKFGVDPLTGDPVDAAVAKEANKLGALFGIKHEKGNYWDLVRGAWGESALASLSFHTTNFLNGILQNAIDNVMQVPTPKQFLRAYQLARGGVDDPTNIQSVKFQLPGEQDLNIYGRTYPQAVFQRGLGQNLTRSRSTVSPGAELISKIPLPGSGPVSRGYGRIMLFNRQIGQSIETNLRAVPYAATFDQHMMERLPALDDEIRQLAKQDVADRVSLVQMRTPQPGQSLAGELSPENVYSKLVDAGAEPGIATRISRDLAHEQNVAHELGLKRMKDAQFSYEKTNLDQMFAKFVPFMYWQSRAFPKYTEEALRNPTLALTYFREMQATEDANNDPGLSARAKGFLGFMGTYAGFTALLNPQALWGIANIYDNGNDFTPEGMTPTGEAVQWMQNHGLHLYPWFDAALNLTGMLGDTFEPDFFGIRQKAIIAAGLQYATARAGLPPPGAPMSALTGKMRQDVSQFLADLGAPGWFTRPVYQKAGLSQSEITVDRAIENRIISNHTDPTTGQTDLTNQQLLAIMNDPTNPEYHKAYQEIATAGLIQQINNFISPVKLKLKDSETDVRSAVTSTIYDAAQKAGVEPWNLKPTVADVEFATGYKMLTGRDWTPSSYEDAKLLQDLVDAPQPAKQFIIDDHDYQQLQTPDYNEFMSMLNGQNPKTASLSSEGRRQYALQWADENGKMADLNTIFTAQKIFRATHPEFDQFKQWQSGMFGLAGNYPDGTLAEYRAEASRINPNAKVYFDQLNQKALRFYPTDANARLHYIEQQTTSAAAWFAITGQAMSRQDNIPIPLAPGQPPQDYLLTQMTPTAPDASTPSWLAHLGVNWNRE